jgi:prepilin peptidase CpaA
MMHDSNIAAAGTIDYGLAVAWIAVIAASTTAAIWDGRCRRIPNLLTIPLLLTGIIYSGLVWGGTGIQNSMWGCVVLAFPYICLFVIGGGGAGDAKLMGGIGAWLGLAHALPVLAAVAISGGVLAIGYALLQRRLRATAGNLKRMATGAGMMAIGAPISDAQGMLPTQTQMLKMPYGIPIFVGTLSAAGWGLLWH